VLGLLGEMHLAADDLLVRAVLHWTQ
jgi:hypothetical protein